MLRMSPVWLGRMKQLPTLAFRWRSTAWQASGLSTVNCFLICPQQHKMLAEKTNKALDTSLPMEGFYDSVSLRVVGGNKTPENAEKVSYNTGYTEYGAAGFCFFELKMRVLGRDLCQIGTM